MRGAPGSGAGLEVAVDHGAWDLVKRYGLMDTLDADHFYPTIGVAVAAVEGTVDGRG